MQRIRHHTISEQVGEINAALRGHYAYYGVAGNLRSLVKVYRVVERYWRRMLCSRSWPDAASPGTPSTKSKNGHRYCHLNCASHTRSCRRLQCCEPTSEERWCGKSARHVLWEPGRVTASGDPVDVENGAMAQPVRHRQTKGAATDMLSLLPPRHISTLPKAVDRPLAQ